MSCPASHGARLAIAAALFLLALPQGTCAQESGDVWTERLAPARPLYGKSDTVTLIAIGDIMLHSRQMEYPFGPFLEGISGRLREADIAVGNMEFTLGGEPYSGYPAFSAPNSYAEYAAGQGINVFLTANNHILDKGATGLERTLSVYREMEEEGKVRYTGSASGPEDREKRYPLFVCRKGISVAILNFTYGTNVPGNAASWPKVNRMEREDILQAIGKAELAGADFIVAFPHWGAEYGLKHGKSQEDMAKWLVAQGVDAVIGSHPHVVQDSARIDGKPVFYSIGNAVSNMSAANTQLELAVKLRFVRTENGDTGLLDPEVTYLWCSLPGRFRENYATIAVEDQIGRRAEWKSPYDHDKMMETYRRVREVTGVRDNIENKIAR